MVGDTNAPESACSSPAEETLPGEELQPLLDLVARYRGVEDTLRRAREHADHARRELDPAVELEACPQALGEGPRRGIWRGERGDAMHMLVNSEAAADHH